MKTCIVGLGETGKAITALLINTFKNAHHTILDPDPSISGRVLDLQHAASFNNSTLSVNDYTAASEAAYVFFCAGTRNPKGTSRETTAKTNKELIDKVFQNFSPYKTAKIIVVTNPVELITEWISEYFDHQITVIGTGTALDTYRLHWLIHQETGYPIELITIPVLGEHGEGMTPIYSQGKINLPGTHDKQKVDTLISKEKLDIITQSLKDSAKTIRLTEEATSFGVAQCALHILHAFEQEKPTELPISIQITPEYKNLLNIADDIFISILCAISKNGITVNPPLPMTSEELLQLKQAASHILGIDKTTRKSE